MSDEKCPECKSSKATYYTVSEHFQGYKFTCDSVPSHSWAGRPHIFNQSKKCLRIVISHLRHQLAERDEQIKALKNTPCSACRARMEEARRLRDEQEMIMRRG